ncbi:hypothetical protein PVAND_006962 [Polypedilum vanderplanki]|uniref:t-SNARE coiled-coil homology domain-containing protein n=1 Tax=Polypedilum vanderplanki TaxID=319348 RepID=A0A9J6C5K7_POLVA|nr:hypothetical protein PVAND_006962 [Polypedilum vanderplanki]
MSLINIEDNEDVWLTELSALQNLGQRIQIQITERDSQNSTAEYNKISARIRIQLKQFENEHTQLNKKLQILAKNRKVTSDEKERRMRILEGLATKKIQLDSRFQNTPSSSSRAKLFETAKRNNPFNDDDDDDDRPILDTNTSIEVFRDEQQQIIRQQDDSLESLSKVISRQKNIAIRIGTEVDNQNDIIDNIAEQMDRTSTRVSSSTRNVEDVAAKDSTFGYWIVIISLFVAIIIVGIL